MNTFTVSQCDLNKNVWTLVTFQDGEYCDEIIFHSREQAEIEGMRWVNDCAA